MYEVLHCHQRCENTHKVFCDLLAELVKFNPPQCVRLHHCLLNCEGVAAFAHMVTSNIVNASVLVHVLTLTASDLSCPPRSWRAAQQRGDLDRAGLMVSSGDPSGAPSSQSAVASATCKALDDYACMPVQVLKRLMAQRSLDPSSCLEKADLIDALRNSDRAAAAQHSDEHSAAAAPTLEPEPELKLTLEEAQGIAAAQQMSLDADTFGGIEPWHAGAMGAPALLVSRERAQLTMALIDALDSRVAEHDNLCFINVSSLSDAHVAIACVCICGRRVNTLCHFRRRV